MIGESAVYRRLRLQKQGSIGRWYIGYDAIIFTTIAVFYNGIFLFQYFQSPELNQDLIWIGIFQILTALMGYTVGILITRKDLEVSMPSKSRITETYVNGIIYSGIVLMMDSILSSTLSGQWGFAQSSLFGIEHIPFTAAVVEEAFFSMGISIVLYKVFKNVYGNTELGEMLVTITTSIITGVFFAMIHMWVYQTAMVILIILTINRIIYAGIFVKYKNLSMVIVMHMFHNGLALLLG